MLTQLLIRDETTASLGKPIHTFTVAVSGESISARELIEARVTQEVEKYNNEMPAVVKLLVRPSDAEQTLNGFKLPKKRHIDPQAQVQKAVEAFEGNGFIVLVDDRQVETLDECITLRPEMEVIFMKLVPLVGG